MPTGNRRNAYFKYQYRQGSLPVWMAPFALPLMLTAGVFGALFFSAIFSVLLIPVALGFLGFRRLARTKDTDSKNRVIEADYEVLDDLKKD